jgi:phosphohistidine phosphatase
MGSPYSVYVIRHGRAEERGAAWPNDSKRPLTSRGAARMSRAARGLRRLGVVVDVVLTSPFVRTRQTAELLAAELKRRPPVVPLVALAPGGSLKDVLRELVKRRGDASVALVGHEPGVSELVAGLAGASSVAFGKGSVCRIDLNELSPAPVGVLRWFATSRLLRALADEGSD